MKDFHHFKGKDLSRSEKIQRLVVEMLLKSSVPDEKRENSIVWELKHSAGCCQIGRILAQKRGLNVEIAEIISVLHDIYAIIEGKYESHAKRGAAMAKDILEKSGDFTPEETALITEAIAHHSEKEIYSGNAYAELIKDVDVLDCSLYENSESFYILHKPKNIYDEYVRRAKKARKELGLDDTEVFRKGK
ncbi:MAG: HD domain-containing protein [Candidatus Woesearchaeota archaeon]